MKELLSIMLNEGVAVSRHLDLAYMRTSPLTAFGVILKQVGVEVAITREQLEPGTGRS